MRRDYEQFVARGAEIVSIGPEPHHQFRRYWEDQAMPFVGLADPRHAVAGLYGQRVKLLRFGRLPSVVIVDWAGRVRYRHHASNMADIPDDETLLAVLDALNDEEDQSDAEAPGLRGDIAFG